MHTPTDTEIANIARRWSDHPDFGWVAGMLTDTGARILNAPDRENGRARVVDARGTIRHLTDADLEERWPDLRDAATVGALWALLGEAHPTLSVSCTGLAWFASVLRDGARYEVAVAYSRVGVLVAAWEAL